jgi:hypothetical protein
MRFIYHDEDCRAHFDSGACACRAMQVQHVPDGWWVWRMSEEVDRATQDELYGRRGAMAPGCERKRERSGHAEQEPGGESGRRPSTLYGNSAVSKPEEGAYSSVTLSDESRPRAVPGVQQDRSTAIPKRRATPVRAGGTVLRRAGAGAARKDRALELS